MTSNATYNEPRISTGYEPGKYTILTDLNSDQKALPPPPKAYPTLRYSKSKYQKAKMVKELKLCKEMETSLDKPQKNAFQIIC